MDGSLRGKTALVTGGSRGIGRSIALALGAAGVRVAVNHRVGDDEPGAVVNEIRDAGGEAIAANGDVSSPSEVGAMVESVSAVFGPIDILVSNAGIARPLPLDELHLATWDATFAVNLRGAFIVSSACLPAMRERRWGRLVYVSSTAARVGGIVGPHYAASKAGLEGLMRSYARILAPEGITSNAVAPALIETAMLGGNADANARHVPVGRLGTSEEVADVVMTLVRNGYITGQTFQVNGGLHMT